jgi:hypothetical protein
MTLEPDRNQIEIFVNTLFRGARVGDYVSIRGFYHDKNEPIWKKLPPVRVESSFNYLIDVAEDYARRAANVPRPAVFSPILATFNNSDHAREQDLLQGFTISVDFDSHPRQSLEQLAAILGPATAVIKTGGVWANGAGTEDKLQAHWRITKPAEKEELLKLKRARQLAARLVGADPTSNTIVHPMRWPGSWHRKAEPRMCTIETCDTDIEVDLDDALDKLLKASPTAADGDDELDKDDGKDSTDGGELTANIVTGKNLHDSILRLAASYIGSGMSASAAVNALRALMNTSRSRQERPQEWESRYNDIPRAVTTAVGKYNPPPDPPPKPLPAEPRTLDQVHKTFEEWFGKEYDFGALDAVLATAAAERLPGDPVCLILISGPGNAKTETVQSVSGAGAHVISTITSDAALLSATPRRQRSKNATGGLLRKIGERGILIIKDVTSILSVDRNIRAAILAALREVYHGHWVRNLGTDGGQTLTWKGRLAVIGACTTAWDTHHAVIAIMGDRFVTVRSDSNTGRITGGLQAIRNTGDEVRMRKELATAVAGLMSTVDPAKVYAPTNADAKTNRYI